MDAQLKRGILNICILKLLETEDRYGYEIVKTMQQYFKDTDERRYIIVIFPMVQCENIIRLHTWEKRI